MINKARSYSSCIKLFSSYFISFTYIKIYKRIDLLMDNLFVLGLLCEQKKNNICKEEYYFIQAKARAISILDYLYGEKILLGKRTITMVCLGSVSKQNFISNVATESVY